MTLRRIGFNILVLPILFFISLLPFPLLYLVSDVVFVLVYYVFGYRRKVVAENLRNAFPQKSDSERALIGRQFYRQFCDVILETVKLLTIPRKVLMQRCVLLPEAVQEFERLHATGRSVIGILGHCGNWEWGAISHSLFVKNHISGVYHPLHNQETDRLMIRLRGRFGTELVPMKLLLRHLVGLIQKGKTTTVGLIADQTPPPEGAYWTQFLNQDTPIFNGPEKLARRFNCPVVYVKMTKIKRGYYEFGLVKITENPQQLAEGEISELHTRALEANILEQPALWLWSHRRWKHRRVPGNAS